GVKSPLEIISAVTARDREAGETLMRQMRAFRPRLVVNQVRTPADAEIGHAVVAAWKKYFGLEMDYLGCITYEDEMWKTVRARRPLLLESPGSGAAQAFARIADGLIALDAAAGPSMPPAAIPEEEG